jgi:hypothetical protein
MKNIQLTAIIEREGDGYVGLCPEFDIPVRVTLLRRRGRTFRKLWNSSSRPLMPQKLIAAVMPKFL